MSEEDGEGGATTIQCGVLGDLEGEGGNDLRRRGANDDDAVAAQREEHHGPWRFRRNNYRRWWSRNKSTILK